jgi:hypothetical protein
MVQFETTMRGLLGCYPQPFDDNRMSSYYVALCDLTPDQFGAAAVAAMRTERYMPTPARLRELVPGSGARLLTESDRTPFERAWADLCDGNANADVERTMASVGGWDAWQEKPISRVAFLAAFNGFPDEAMRLTELGR